MMKTHKFCRKVFRIDRVRHLDGITSTDREGNTISMIDGKGLEHLDTAIHEALEAMGAPNRLLHYRDGTSRTGDIARFLWRLGWRRVYWEPIKKRRRGYRREDD